MSYYNQPETIFKEKTTWKGKEYFCEYVDGLDFSKIAPVTQVQVLCFLSTDKFVIYEDKEGKYGLPGGTVEKGESLKEALFRELKEEAAVKPIEYGPLMYLKVTNLSEKPQRTTYQARYWALVDLLNKDIKDPDGKATKRHLVDKDELFKCVNWGKKLEIYVDQFKKLRKQI